MHTIKRLRDINCVNMIAGIQICNRWEWEPLDLSGMVGRARHAPSFIYDKFRQDFGLFKWANTYRATLALQEIN